MIDYESIEQLLGRAVALHQQGRLSEAGTLYARVLARHESQPDALHMLGVVRTQCGEAEAGAELIERSLAVNAAQPAAWANLGNAQLNSGQPAVALESFRRAIALDGGYAPSYNGHGGALLALDRPAEAAASFERALAIWPRFPQALENKAAAELRSGDESGALQSYSRLLEWYPDHLPSLAQRALLLVKLARHEEALRDCETVLARQGDHREARYLKATALLALGRPEATLDDIESRETSHEQYPELWVLWGHALRRLGRSDEARWQYERALKSSPDSPEALLALGIAATADRDFARAARVLAVLEKVAPDGKFHRGICLHAKLHQYDWGGYEGAVTELAARVARGESADLPFTFLSISDDAALQRRCAESYVAALPRPPRTNSVAHSRQSRVRVAYVSADFLEHPIAYLLAGLFESHDRDRFETLAISLRSDSASPMAQRLRLAFDRFIDASQNTDEDIAALMRECKVDIAVDLMGYTAEERPGILLRRAAPIQVNYLGYPGTLGSDHIDYLLADEFVVPEGMAQNYSEKIVHLPGCFQANDGRRMLPAALSRAQAGLPKDALVFASFVTPVKLNPQMFTVWMRLLAAHENSVLWLIAHNEVAKENLRGEAKLRGIDPVRVIFAERVPYPEHLSRLALADIGLDTWPFNGGATTSDLLWCGVPLVTMTGEAFASRMSASLLRALDLEELVAHDFHEYQSIALALAKDRSRRRSLCDRLISARTAPGPFDTRAVTRAIESAYLGMYERLQRGEAPASFAVRPHA